MKYIYARVSTDKQETNNQVHNLKQQYPDAVVIEEIASGVKARPMLTDLIGKLQQGDTLIVAALDRLGRRTSQVLALIEDLEKRGVILKSVREGVDYSTITGRLVTQILISVAEMERNILSERTREGLAARRAAGIRLGAPTTFSPETIELVKVLREQGLPFAAIAQRTGVSATYCWKICQRE